MSEERAQASEQIDLGRFIEDVADFPRPGIVFKDMTPLLANPEALRATLTRFEERWRAERVGAVVGIESRGFIFGAALAVRLDAAFVPVRKPGKLPRAVDRVAYALEYGEDAVEMHLDALSAGQRVLIVDDLIATGGTAAAALELVRRRGAEPVGAAFVIELAFLAGRDRLGDLPIQSLLTY